MLGAIFNIQGASTLINGFLTFVLIVYTLFAFLVVRQVRQLNRSFQTEASFLLTTIAFGHFIATILLLLFTVMTLLA